jgi:hypothetical protein
MTEEERQSIVDAEQLRFLSICYIISGGLSALGSCIGLFYAFMGVMFASIISSIPAKANQAPPPPAAFGGIFVVFGLSIFSVMMALAILKFVTAKRLSQRRSRELCMVVAALSCIGVPLGTALGVFTFIVLSRPSVVRLFNTQATTTPVAPSPV